MSKVSYIDFIAKVADETGLKKVDIKKVIDTAFNGISVITAAGDDIHLGNAIGTFKSKRTKETVKPIPGTDKTVLVAAKTVLKFQPSKAFKATVNSVK